MTTIWRYMDLWKFESILKKQALFFSSASSQTDRLEGTYPLMAKLNRALRFSHLPERRQGYALHNQEISDQISTNEIILSCWHVNEDENLLMWTEYIEKDEGVAIQTTQDVLTTSFIAFSHPELITIKKVQYINRTTFHGHLLNDRINVFFQKEESFAWENELRCAIDVTIGPLSDDPKGNWNAEHLFPKGSLYPIGYFVPVAVNTLIQRIIISPNASDQFYTDVKNICHKHGIAKPIERSHLHL